MLGRGNSLEAMQQALAVLDVPGAPAAAWRVLGEAELLRDDGHEAARAFERYVALRPDDAEAWHNLGLARDLSSQPGSARDAFEQALALAPNLVATRSQLCHLKRRLCDWEGLAALSDSLRAAVGRGEPGVAPFAFLPSRPRPRSSSRARASRQRRCSDRRSFWRRHEPPRRARAWARGATASGSASSPPASATTRRAS
jgi:tetratricopeptide (TPR) repeat protein